MSSGSALRRIGTLAAMACFAASGRNAVASVIVRPGAMVFTRIPTGPNSVASVLTKASKPDLAVQCEIKPLSECLESVLDTTPMLPRRWLIIAGASALQQ